MSDDVPWGGRTAHRLRRAFLLALVTCLAAATAAACSKSPYHTLVQPNDAFILGRAGADTLLAGAGSVQFRVAAGHFGPASDRQIYGLVVDVERVVGPAQSRIPKGVTRVVIVPWDYGADCQPTPYARSARWVEPGMRGMYSATLRPSSAWVAGTPTLDAFSPSSEPYVARPKQRGALNAGRADSALSIADMMELMDRLPEVGAMQRDPAKATAALYGWVHADPSRLRAYPAAEIARSLRFMERQAALSAVHHPAIGTFRLTLDVVHHVPLTIFVRTVATPTTGMRSRSTPLSADPTVVPAWVLHTYLLFIALTAESLPAGCDAYSQRNEQAYLTLAALTTGSTSNDKRFATWIELDAFARAFPEDSAMQSIASLAFEAFSERQKRSEPVLMPGAIELSPHGSARVSQQETFSNGIRATITGERLSEQTIRCDRGH